jgi:pyruvate formate lyase activating enzyme
MKDKNHLKTVMEGCVFNIQKFSLHDGTGIRTLVFLKGCPLNCLWCANPEGKNHYPEIAYNPEKCIGVDQCGACLRICPNGAVSRDAQNKAFIERDCCSRCGLCADCCPSHAMEVFGKTMTVEEVIRIVEEDGAFYSRSGGGLTLSGGEPLDQPGFSLALLEKAQSRGLRTAIETSGLARWEILEAVCRHADQVFYDIKSLDRKRHVAGTGVDNTRIAENLKKLCSDFPSLPITVRTPVVPGFNDSAAEIRAIRDFLSAISADVIHELLPYHRFGESKYRSLGIDYPLKDAPGLTEKIMETLRSLSNRSSSL